MGLIKDITGQKFGMLLVISEISERTKNRQVLWSCICDCGSNTIVLGNHLKNGHTSSCGCKRVYVSSSKGVTHGFARRGKQTSTYRIWCNMKYRCSVPTYKEYHLYGGRGIKVCKRWDKFENFLNDMGERPSLQHSLDRFPNLNGDYKPSNCRWATHKEQAGNKRNNRWIEHLGNRMILADWARHLNTTPSAILLMMKKKDFTEIYNYYNK